MKLLTHNIIPDFAAEVLFAKNTTKCEVARYDTVCEQLVDPLDAVFFVSVYLQIHKEILKPFFIRENNV